MLSGTINGDVNGDGGVDVADLDAITAAIAAGNGETQYDVDGNGDVDGDDRTFWVTDIKGTLFGDANLDQVVDSTDLNAVGLNWQSTTVTSWADGDFNGDGKINSSDLNDVGRNWQVAAAATATVPEPSGLTLLSSIVFAAISLRRRMC